MMRDHRRLLAVGLSVLAMAVASAGNADPSGPAERPGADRPPVCSVPVGFESSSLYDGEPTSASTLRGLAGAAAAEATLLPARVAAESAPPRGVFSRAAWSHTANVARR